MTREDIAKVSYAVNRAYCESLGDFSFGPWEEAPEWQQQSAISGVVFHLKHPSAGPEASHNSWLDQKVADGWVYGETKDAEAKTHPCIVEFSQLPAAQQAKDYIFTAIVHNY